MHSRTILTVVCIAVWAAVGLSAIDRAQGADTTAVSKPVMFDIKPQPLASALNAFAVQSHQQILFTPEIAAAKTSSGIKGPSAPDAALAQLLTGTGLVPSRSTNGMILVSAADAEGASAKSDPPLAPNGATNNQEQDRPTAGLEEVVVTAQKRAERLQDVPITVTVVTGETLKNQGVTDVTQLQYTTPELVYTGGPGPSFSIRGIGTQTFNATASSDVLVVVDGVTQGQWAVPTNSLFDVQRVEVLSGPQGMLFGKNASAGVINIISNPPDPRAFSASLHSDIGENGYQVYQGVANLPLTANSALRLSVFSNSEDGLIKNVYTNKDIGAISNFGGRASYLYQNDQIKLNVIADYEQDHGGQMVWSPIQAVAPLAQILAACGLTPSKSDTTVCLDGPASHKLESYGLSAQVDIPLGRYTLTSITADRQFNLLDNKDTDSINQNVLNTNQARFYDNQFSEELRITSPAYERIEYVAGLYYYNFSYLDQGLQAGGLFVAPVPILLTNSEQKVNQFSYAAFGQATVHLVKGLNLIVGGRETRDITATRVAYTCNAAIGLCIPGVTALGEGAGSINNNNFSYRLGLQYEFNRNNMVYATYTRGYKGPAVNSPTAGPATIVNPEIPLYTEVGFKSQLLDNKIDLQIAVFHDIVKDFQAEVYQASTTPASFIFANASKLTSEGVQINVNTHPIAGLTVGGGLLYNHAVYGPFLVQCDAYLGCATYNVEGRQLAQSPRWTGTFNVDYSRKLTQHIDGFINANISYRDGTSSLAIPDPNLEISAYTLVNGRLGLRFDNGRYGVAIFARNLFDYRFAAVRFPDIAFGGLNYDQALTPDSFRTVGVSLDARF